MLSTESINSAEKQMAKNRRIFERWVRYALNAPNDEEMLYRIYGAFLFVCGHGAGVLSEPRLEIELLRIAQTIPSEDLNQEYEPNSFLHIFTFAEEYGGHARVVERWLQTADKEQEQTVLFVDQRNWSIPSTLTEAVQKCGGQILFLSETDKLQEKAKKLRSLASRYEHVILHINPFDVVSILAFGTEEFKRPVCFFNHTDHLFWAGGSVADAVINFRHFSDEINRTRRGIDRNLYLPLPISRSTIQATSESHNVREKLGIPSNHKILFTMARAAKYKPMYGYDFAAAAGQLLQQLPETTLLAIGPSPNEKYWHHLIKDFPGRVKILGIVPIQETVPYVQESDLVWDSFPIGSLTSLLDSCKLGKPVLTLRTPLLQGLYEEAGILCDSQEKLVEKSIALLKNEEQYTGNLYEYLEKNNFPEGWRSHLSTLLAQAPATHKLWPIHEPEPQITEMEYFALLDSESNLLLYKHFPVLMNYLIERAQKVKITHPQLIKTCRSIFSFINNFSK